MLRAARVIGRVLFTSFNGCSTLWSVPVVGSVLSSAFHTFVWLATMFGRVVKLLTSMSLYYIIFPFLRAVLMGLRAAAVHEAPNNRQTYRMVFGQNHLVSSIV